MARGEPSGSRPAASQGVAASLRSTASRLQTAEAPSSGCSGFSRARGCWKPKWGGPARGSLAAPWRVATGNGAAAGGSGADLPYASAAVKPG